jgi:hypothetical protein
VISKPDRRLERGAAAIEVGLIMAFVLIPVMMLLLLVPTWIERQTAGHDAASEAARAIVLSSGDLSVAAAKVASVERGYALPTGTISLSSVSSLAVGAEFTVVVTVRQPALSLPGLGQLGGWRYDAEHIEFYPEYAQLLP